MCTLNLVLQKTYIIQERPTAYVYSKYLLQDVRRNTELTSCSWDPATKSETMNFVYSLLKFEF